MREKECRVHKIVADVAALAAGRVLLVKYLDVSRYDGQRGWFLPDDFVGVGEHPEQAARRILRGQTGLSAGRLALSHVESFGGGKGGAWHLIFHYRADLRSAAAPGLGPNVAAAEWFPLRRLPPKRDVAHGGWALDVLRDVRRRR